MNSFPSFCVSSVCRAIPWGLKPYITPKFRTLAILLISGVTDSKGIPYTKELVAL